VKLPGDTATEFRTKVLKPFLDAHLKTARQGDTPPCSSSSTGTMQWQRLQKWPVGCESGCRGHDEADLSGAGSTSASRSAGGQDGAGL